MTVGVRVEAWALPIGVPPGVIAVALAAVAMKGGGATIGVPPGVVAFALAAAATAAASSLGGGGGSRHRSVARRELGLMKL